MPFTSYDFWAYLSAGFLLLFAVDAVIGTKLVLRDSWSIVQSVVAISLAYVVGQLIASASAAVFEKVMVGKLFGYPRDTLFGKSKASKGVQRLLPGYFTTLPAVTQSAALEKGQKQGVGQPGEALFWVAFAYARQTPAVMSRLENFLNLYGFCRNMALVAFVDAALFYWSYLQSNGPSEHLLWSRLSFIVAIGMTLRYLKFFRLYANEVFTSFAYAKEPEKNP